MVRTFLPDILDRPLKQFPTLLPHLFSDAWDTLFDDDAPQTSTRGVRMYEEGNHLTVEVPLPGLDPNDIELSVDNGILRVNGECSKEQGRGTEKSTDPNKKKIYRSCSRKYSYTLALPVQIDESTNVDAEYVDGILKVSLELSKTKQARKIPIKAGHRK